ncbi:unnamed protein product [Linum trigynum]|uniref:Uncharacterized protein n=1 Tax=Linum trigynum TaxID=586398 RepID=A0AAV2DAG7_9ROSI
MEAGDARLICFRHRANYARHRLGVLTRHSPVLFVIASAFASNHPSLWQRSSLSSGLIGIYRRLHCVPAFSLPSSRGAKKKRRRGRSLPAFEQPLPLHRSPNLIRWRRKNWSPELDMAGKRGIWFEGWRVKIEEAEERDQVDRRG